MFDLRFPYPGHLSAPKGYEKVFWEEVSIGEEVYLACLDHQNPTTAKALGPFRISRKFLLENSETKQAINEPGERLLRRSSSTETRCDT